MTNDFHIWQATSIFGKEATARNDKNTHQVIMIKRYETTNLASLNAT